MPEARAAGLGSSSPLLAQKAEKLLSLHTDTEGNVQINKIVKLNRFNHAL